MALNTSASDLLSRKYKRTGNERSKGDIKWMRDFMDCHKSLSLKKP